jgi:hypothetical protein
MKNQKQKDLKSTEIVVVLDRSGSMGSIAPETVEGFNKFLTEQQNSEGEAYITLVQFDDRYELNYQSIPVKNAQPLILGESFVPRGSTALLDAIGKTIENLDTKRDVVFVIITDGEENSSSTYERKAINKMIDALQKEEGWKFLFLAANQDAIAAGSSIGIKASNAMSYDATGDSVASVFYSVSSNMASYRSAKITTAASLQDLESEISFKDSQRKDAKK